MVERFSSAMSVGSWEHSKSLQGIFEGRGEEMAASATSVWKLRKRMSSGGLEV